MPAVTLDDAKVHLRVDGDYDDALIQIYIDAALAHIDGPDGWLGRAVSPQTIVATFDNYDAPSQLPLPCLPANSITSISYIDNAGIAQIVPPEGYYLARGVVFAGGAPAWTGAAARAGAIAVTYEAGYEVCPDAIKAALLLMVGDLWRFRETATTDASSVGEVPMSMTVQKLLAPFRVWR